MATTPLARTGGLTVHPATHGRFDVRTMVVAPRADLPFARSTKISHVDDRAAWSVRAAVTDERLSHVRRRWAPVAERPSPPRPP